MVWIAGHCALVGHAEGVFDSAACCSAKAVSSHFLKPIGCLFVSNDRKLLS